MDKRIETFLDYVINKDSVSEAFFELELKRNNQLFAARHIREFSHKIELLLQRWAKEFMKDTESTASIHPQYSSDSDNDNNDDDEEESQNNETTPKLKSQTQNESKQAIQSLSNTILQSERLLQLLYQSRKLHQSFADLYFQTLLKYIKTDIEEMMKIVLQQIEYHLNDNANEVEKSRFNQFIAIINQNSCIGASHVSLLNDLTCRLAVNSNESDNREDALKNIKIAYPYVAYYIDVHREFRDSVAYFLDGDSLMLYVAHHINVDLVSSCGNTLHVIYIIEQILEGLFNQSNRCNFTVLFFDCNYRIYEHQVAILDLIRACLIAHLSKNIAKYGPNKVHIFDSWKDKNYLEFYEEKRPMFMFYHSISNISNGGNSPLPPSTLKQLTALYYVFGNYHQLGLNINVYLMDKLSLNNMFLYCFIIHFKKQIPQSMINICIQQAKGKNVKATDRQNRYYQKEYETFCRELHCNDIRLLIYLRTIRILLDDSRINVQGTDLLGLCIPFFLLHVSLLIRLSLPDRHLSSKIVSMITSPTLTQLIMKFQQTLDYCLNSETSLLCWTHVADMFDGRLFTFTLQWLYQSSKDHCFDSETIGLVKQTLNKLGINLDISDFKNSLNKMIQLKHIQFVTSSLNVSSTVVNMQRQKVVKISNPLVDLYLKPIYSTMTDGYQFDLISPDECHATVYEGRHHWHVFKEVGDEISRIRNNNDSMTNAQNYRYRTKKQQRFYTYFTLYGRSLTSRDVKNDQLQNSLASIPCSVEADTTLPTPDDKKKNKKKKPVHVSKANAIREQIEKEKQRKNQNEEGERLTTIKEYLHGIPSGKWTIAIAFIDQHLPHFVTPIHRSELLKLKFRSQRKYLQSLRTTTNPTNEEKSILNRLQISCFVTMTQLLEVDPVKDPFVEKEKYMRELMDDSVLDIEKWYRFQMEKINSCLPRVEKGLSDTRISDFMLDQWQVQFLDAVDQEQTIIIVAPTASGKTYASYYAMQKVLTNSKVPNGICVYVAPTKALVNQVAATVYSKFGPVFGIFTRDYRVNMESCRILVTVPQCFEILLVSSGYQRWCQRIQYAIFDEIHCMSGEIASDVWERTMALINCPMIGLSATVNNGGDLCTWLQHLEQKRASLFQSSLRKVCLIIHHERSADLNKYVYAQRELHPIHPIGFINSKELGVQALPKDFSLSPCETIQLRDAMENATQNNTVAKKNPLFPSLTDYFSPAWVIDRSKCNEYSRLVHDKFNELIANRDHVTIDTIAKSLDMVTSQQIRYPESKQRHSLIIDFVLTLKEKDLLPCIVFSDNRQICESMAAAVANYFENLEQDLRQTTYRQQIAAAEAKIEQNQKSQKMITKMTKKMEKSLSGKRDSAEDSYEKQSMINDIIAGTQLTGRENELLYGILPEATLANRTVCDRELADEFIGRTDYSNDTIISFMRRGVAYHHAGLNNKNRIAVEALFRNRYIQIVFSTSTLALGIHMPTKTVAFLSDSIYLDALQYRQSSGRAGRRGFDIQGHTVFLDIPIRKIRHLIMSNIPDIKAHFPITITFVMRLLHLFFHGSDRTDALHRSLIVLEDPFLLHFPSINYHLVDTQIRFHVLHTLDFLNQVNMVNEQGDLVGLAGLATHLHYFQPANLALVYLIDTKLFHQLSNDEEILIVLAYLFTQIPWLKQESEIEQIQSMRKKKKFNSMLFLPTISSHFRRRIDSYNAKVREIYSIYIENVTRRMRMLNPDVECCLPVSGVSFTHSVDYDEGTFEYQLHHHYSQQIQNPSISPFAGLSGLTHEKFMSNYHSNTCSWDLFCDLNLSDRVVPYLDLECRDHTNVPYRINSYALDFYRIGSDRLLEEENELQSGNIYNHLLDFQLILSSIKTSLEIIIANEMKQHCSTDLEFLTPFYKAMERIHTNFSEKFYRVYPRQYRL